LSAFKFISAGCFATSTGGLQRTAAAVLNLCPACDAGRRRVAAAAQREQSEALLAVLERADQGCAVGFAGWSNGQPAAGVQQRCLRNRQEPLEIREQPIVLAGLRLQHELSALIPRGSFLAAPSPIACLYLALHQANVELISCNSWATGCIACECRFAATRKCTRSARLPSQLA